MKHLKLSKRLETIAGYLEQDSAVADIGTDHGYIPVYLAQNKIARRIIATDIRKGPLARAKLTSVEYGVADRIEFRLTDGLDGLHDQGLDTIIIAGMGGETIAGILERAPWVLSKNVRIILQPQSKLGALSSWLDNNRYAIYDETLANEGARFYVVLLAGAGSRCAPLSCAELYADRILIEKRDPLLPGYLDMLIAKTKKAIDGMEQARSGVRMDELIHHMRALEGFIRMKEETETWQL
ncbi:MAG: SAM-dependent methyltransferase [Clostridiales bacterium]|jgi:tRNA (adenine22-N1)-methyltransferase|nr:SAM-dependent methyltransferase [Clostridiales bacterium]